MKHTFIFNLISLDHILRETYNPVPRVREDTREIRERVVSAGEAPSHHCRLLLRMKVPGYLTSGV